MIQAKVRENNQPAKWKVIYSLPDGREVAAVQVVDLAVPFGAILWLTIKLSIAWAIVALPVVVAWIVL